MKNNIFKLLMVLVVFVLLSGCNGSRYAQGGDRSSSHHQGVNNRHYQGY